MANLEAYERNLHMRLAELRAGDPAYETHGNAVLETLPYVASSSPENSVERILDVGCGLGFLSLRMAEFPRTQVMGIDPSQTAIDLAKTEHTSQPNLAFLAVSAELFPGVMQQERIEPFDRAILNMVLHSIDDENCLKVLASTRQTLAPHGVLTCIVPGQSWLLQKLVEKAQAEGMSREAGIPWVADQMTREAVDIAVNISGQPSYPEPIRIWNRDLEDYARLLQESGYGVDVERSYPRPTVMRLPFWEWNDHLSGYDLTQRDRHILMTQKI